MIRCQIINKVIIFILFLNVLCVVKAYAQYDSLLKIKAMLIVEGDLSNFDVINNQAVLSLNDVRNNYSIDTISSDRIYDCYFLKVTPLIKSYINSCTVCSYYLAYDANANRLYRLSGFKNSEFAEFYNRVLLGGGVLFPKKMRNNKERRKYIFANISIDGIDLKDYYRRYYLNNRNSLYDTSSCYRKIIITAY